MKGLKTYLIIGAVCLVLYIVAEASRPKIINWTETLDHTQKIPYGTYIAYNQLNDIFPGAKIKTYRHTLYDVIADDSLTNSSYIIIAPMTQFDKADYEALEKYMRAGNDVFIAAENFGEVLEKKLNISTGISNNATEDNNPVGFVSPSLDSATYYRVGKRTGNSIFADFDTTKCIVVGKTKRFEANLLKVPFGKGSLYLCANPTFFSNYSLLQADGQKYAATALSFLKNTPQVVWDEYYSLGPENQGSEMRVFLNNPALKWAYYIALFTLIGFVLYEIKRRQRIIPVVAPPANSTISFVSTVGQVYFEKRDNVNITQKIIVYFLEHLRVTYNLKTNPLDQEFIDSFSNKTGIDKGFAIQLVEKIKMLSAENYVSDQQLIELNKLIEQFYIKSR